MYMSLDLYIINFGVGNKMTTKQEFNKVLYAKIKERTVLKKARKTSLPYMSYRSAEAVGRKYGFTARPVTISLIELQEKRLIRKFVDKEQKTYRYMSL